jgi:hypothetical protein
VLGDRVIVSVVERGFVVYTYLLRRVIGLVRESTFEVVIAHVDVPGDLYPLLLAIWNEGVTNDLPTFHLSLSVHTSL